MGSLEDIAASFSAELEELKREALLHDQRLRIATKRIVLRDIVWTSEKLLMELQKQRNIYDDHHNRHAVVAAQLFQLLNLDQYRSYSAQYGLIEFQYNSVLSLFNDFGRRLTIGEQKRSDEWLFIEPLLEEQNSEFNSIRTLEEGDEALERLNEGIRKANEVKTMLENVAAEWSLDSIKQSIEMDFTDCIQQLDALLEEVQHRVLALE